MRHSIIDAYRRDANSRSHSFRTWAQESLKKNLWQTNIERLDADYRFPYLAHMNPDKPHNKTLENLRRASRRLSRHQLKISYGIHHAKDATKHDAT
jgi:hypothetical protein